MKEDVEPKLSNTTNIEIKLIESAVTKRNEILEKAEEEANYIIQKAEQACHQIRDQYNETIARHNKSEIQILKDKIIGEAELEGKKIIIREREEAISLVFQKAEDRLREITDKLDGKNILPIAHARSTFWQDVLIKLVIEAVLAIGGTTFLISTNERDIDLLREQKEVITEKTTEVLGNVQLVILDQSIETMGGVIVQNKEGTKIYYNTLESRLRTVRARSEAVVAKILEVL